MITKAQNFSSLARVIRETKDRLSTVVFALLGALVFSLACESLQIPPLSSEDVNPHHESYSFQEAEEVFRESRFGGSAPIEDPITTNFIDIFGMLSFVAQLSNQLLSHLFSSPTSGLFVGSHIPTGPPLS